MSTWQAVFLPAAFGSAIQELAYWWQLRFKLNAKKYQEQMQSAEYWIVVALMILGSGIGTVFWFGMQEPAAKDSMVLGASFPLIFKHAVDVAGASRPHLGAATSSEGGRWTILRSYFAMR